MRSHTNAGDRWIPEGQYQLICSLVPILCVDLLPRIGDTERFGLIEREDYRGNLGLNLIGGAVLIDEPLEEAVHRHLAATLGADVWVDTETLTLLGVYEYSRKVDASRPHDPRKNAVSVTYVAEMYGEPRPAGEAERFHVFEIAAPPRLEAFGFGQGGVVYDGLRKLAQLRP